MPHFRVSDMDGRIAFAHYIVQFQSSERTYPGTLASKVCGANDGFSAVKASAQIQPLEWP